MLPLEFVMHDEGGVELYVVVVPPLQVVPQPESQVVELHVRAVVVAVLITQDISAPALCGPLHWFQLEPPGNAA